MSEPWPTLIQAGVAIILFVGGYFLGLRQGKDQIRYQSGAKVAVEVGKRMAEIRRTLYLGGHAEEADALKVFKRLVEQKNDLRDYAARSFWLERSILQQVLLINDRLEVFISGWLERYRQHGKPAIDTEAVRVFAEEITPLHEELSRRIDAYLGTGDSFWARARWWGEG